MQVHVGSALLSIPLIVWHVVARPVRPRRTDLSRRALIRGAALASGSVATLGAMEVLVRLAGLRGSERRFTGSYERGSFEPDEMPVTQWHDDEVPVIDSSTWRLAVRAVENDGIADALTFEELEGFDDRGPIRRFAACSWSPPPDTRVASRSLTFTTSGWPPGLVMRCSHRATAIRCDSWRRGGAGSGG